jgi:hypothetical protein
MSDASDAAFRGEVHVYYPSDKKLEPTLHGRYPGASLGQSLAVGLDKQGRPVVVMGGSNSVAVYRHDGTWQPVGSRLLVSENHLDGFSHSLALSEDTQVMVVGSPYYSINNGTQRVGRIQAFKLENEWVPLGNELVGQAQDELFGYSLDITSNYMAVGSVYAGERNGSVAVYELENDTWKQLGGTSFGESSYEFVGEDVSILDINGTLYIAVGSYASASEERSGKVSVYCLQDNAWILVGDSVVGRHAFSAMGTSVSLSANPLTNEPVVAVGAPGDGTSEVFEFQTLH